ncbi:MAG: hypothetical protein K0S63_311, partial [Gammaproteobacteria bacterium]|nr:hypothetical protein [Gammaproteobacteria bacterium]
TENKEHREIKSDLREFLESEHKHEDIGDEFQKKFKAQPKDWPVAEDLKSQRVKEIEAEITKLENRGKQLSETSRAIESKIADLERKLATPNYKNNVDNKLEDSLKTLEHLKKIQEENDIALKEFKENVDNFKRSSGMLYKFFKKDLGMKRPAIKNLFKRVKIVRNLISKTLRARAQEEAAVLAQAQGQAQAPGQAQAQPVANGFSPPKKIDLLLRETKEELERVKQRQAAAQQQADAQQAHQSARPGGP